MNGRKLDQKSANLHSRLSLFACVLLSLAPARTAESADEQGNVATVQLVPPTSLDDTGNLYAESLSTSQDSLPLNQPYLPSPLTKTAYLSNWIAGFYYPTPGRTVLLPNLFPLNCERMPGFN